MAADVRHAHVPRPVAPGGYVVFRTRGHIVVLHAPINRAVTAHAAPRAEADVGRMRRARRFVVYVDACGEKGG